MMDNIEFDTSDIQTDSELCVVDLIREKSFLPREFLTWLWVKSQKEAGTLSIDDIVISLNFERALTLESGISDQKELISLKGKDISEKEIRAALLSGKKISSATIRLWVGDLRWRFTIKADTFDISGMRLESSKYEEEDFSFLEEELNIFNLDAKALENVFLIEKTFDILDVLFKQFLSLRVDKKRWEKEISLIKEWVYKD